MMLENDVYKLFIHLKLKNVGNHVEKVSCTTITDYMDELHRGGTKQLNMLCS